MDVELWSQVRASLRTMLEDPHRNVVEALDELGWAEVSAEDPATATAILFEEHGRALANSEILDTVVRTAVRAEGVAVPDRPVLHPVGGTVERGPEVRGLVLCAPDTIRLLAAVSSPGAGLLLGVLGGDKTERRAAAAPGIDPALGWTMVDGQLTQFEPLAEGASAERAWSAWCAARDRALAAEVVGLTQAMLDVAVDHVSTREQFGRRIGSFQAVRHALADAKVHVEAAREATDAAFESGSAWSAQAAWALAAGGHRVALRHAFQVSGAMGLTWEHAMHLFARRAMALELLAGPPGHRQTQIGRELLDRGVARVPSL